LFDDHYELIVNASHPLTRRNDVDAAALAGEHFLCQSGCEMAQPVADALAANGVVPTNPHEVETDSDLVSLLEANAGIALAPVSMLLSPPLRRLPVRGLGITRTVSVYAVAGRQRSPVAATLLNLLRSADWDAAAAA
jgi:DNA-binding transcriptional LysR family regulator